MERTLELESRLLSQMVHPNIIGFRAAQRLPDGKLCLALEMCECSLYALIQERQFAAGYASCEREEAAAACCVTPGREGPRAHEPLFAADEIGLVGRSIARGLSYLHREHRVLHGDIKSANVLVSRDLRVVKICDLGVSLPLLPGLGGVAQPECNIYEGTEPWRPPETLCASADRAAGSSGGSADTHATDGMALCDRTDVFALGLVVWEMITGDVPHAAARRKGDEGYRAALGTRPPLPPLPVDYRLLEQVFRCCTQREPSRRPAAAEVLNWLSPSSPPDRLAPPPSPPAASAWDGGGDPMWTSPPAPVSPAMSPMMRIAARSLAAMR